MDVVAAEDVDLAPGARHAVATGFSFGDSSTDSKSRCVRARVLLSNSGLPANTPGTIDSDYRGEVKVILANLGSEPFAVRRGDRIAQLVPAPVQRANFLEVAHLDETERGAGGFGSTGI